jgi:hypothetical protein
VKCVKILLSLHSIQLVFISVLAITYLAMTAANSSNRTEPVSGNMPIVDESKVLTLADAESIRGKIEINAITSQTTAFAIVSGLPVGSNAASFAVSADNMRIKEKVIDMWEQKDGDAADRLLSGRRTAKPER